MAEEHERQRICAALHDRVSQDLIAAKVYRPRMFRAMRNDAVYREGREMMDGSGKAVRDRRSLLAIRKKTRHGRGLAAASWLQHEYETMRVLHEAGADVPEPLAEQLNENGYLVAPVGPRDTQDLVLLKRRAGRIIRESICACRFVPLLGKYAFRQ